MARGIVRNSVHLDDLCWVEKKIHAIELEYQ